MAVKKLVITKKKVTKSTDYIPATNKIPGKPAVKKKSSPNKDYGLVRDKLPQRLFGLIKGDGKGQWIAAQVLTPTHHEACIAFQKHFGMMPDLTSKANKDGLQVVELGGMNLPYVQTMRPGMVSQQRDT